MVYTEGLQGFDNDLWRFDGRCLINPLANNAQRGGTDLGYSRIILSGAWNLETTAKTNIRAKTNHLVIVVNRGPFTHQGNFFNIRAGAVVAN